MPRPALLVSSAHADRRYSLHPLARALLPICGKVEHVVFDVEAGHGRSAPATGTPDVESVDGVSRTRLIVPAHRPTRGAPLGAWFPATALERWACFSSPALDQVAQQAGLVIVQSGLAAALILRLRRQRPTAALAYVATDVLAAAHPSIGPVLARRLPLADRVIATRPDLQHELARFCDGVRCFTPPPPEAARRAALSSSPYPDGPHVVILGGAPLDSVTIEIAASAFPDVAFVNVGPAGARVPANVRELGRLPAADVAPFLVHADVALVAGCAAPDEAPDGLVLGEQLALLGHLGIPTVCPQGSADHHPRRYGFDPGRSASLREALALALGVRPKRLPGASQSWDDLAALLATAATGRRTPGRTFVPGAAHAG